MQWNESLDPLNGERKIQNNREGFGKMAAQFSHHLQLLGPPEKRAGSREQIKPRAPSGPLGAGLEQTLLLWELKEIQRNSVQDLWVAILVREWQRAFLTNKSKNGV